MPQLIELTCNGRLRHTLLSLRSCKSCTPDSIFYHNVLTTLWGWLKDFLVFNIHHKLSQRMNPNTKVIMESLGKPFYVYLIYIYYGSCGVNLHLTRFKIIDAAIQINGEWVTTYLLDIILFPFTSIGYLMLGSMESWVSSFCCLLLLWILISTRKAFPCTLLISALPSSIVASFRLIFFIG